MNKMPFVLLLSMMLNLFSEAQPVAKMKDYFGIPAPITFNEKAFRLSWTSHPSAPYYKQEYIPTGESADQFKNMILIELLEGNSTVRELASTKLSELKKMKEANPVINFESFENPATGEYMIDFLVTANSADGKISVAERNVYRYKQIALASGKKGILLFGSSTRAYGDETGTFIAASKDKKKLLVDEVARFKIPAIKLSK